MTSYYLYLILTTGEVAEDFQTLEERNNLAFEKVYKAGTHVMMSNILSM